MLKVHQFLAKAMAIALVSTVTLRPGWPLISGEVPSTAGARAIPTIPFLMKIMPEVLPLKSSYLGTPLAVLNSYG
ncbi:hypothetical protein [Rosenbergiella epipactidis]|uniref:hypothetical protein n=1 Tax=Rosenbergiella epipactidis TaxID=1544694 RepID=UPI001F4DDDEC|nr:hypothetical protein [Rosenbergiella epipactidis]